MQNGYIERFNRTYRQAVPNAHLFEDLMQVRILSEDWMMDYNQRRPHESLGNRTSIAYKEMMACWYVGNSQSFQHTNRLNNNNVYLKMIFLS